jgi:F-type H+-transporting ATPase subunit gamma
MKEIKARIKGVKTTRKITKAMQLVATSHLRKARDTYKSFSDGANIVYDILSAIQNEEGKSIPEIISGRKNNKVHLIIIYTSNKGLCGPFNSSVLRVIKKQIDVLKSDNKTVKIYVIGKKGYSYLEKFYPKLLIPSNLDITSHGNISLDKVSDLVDDIISMFDRGEFDSCDILYNFPKSPMIQETTTEQIIPIKIEASGKRNTYEFDSDYDSTLLYTAKESVRYKLYQALSAGIVSEHSSRMTAMDSATRNSDTLLKKLNLLYNRTRQQHITNELIEIISGSEAV